MPVTVIRARFHSHHYSHDAVRNVTAFNSTGHKRNVNVILCLVYSACCGLQDKKKRACNHLLSRIKTGSGNRLGFNGRNKIKE